MGRKNKNKTKSKKRKPIKKRTYNEMNTNSKRISNLDNTSIIENNKNENKMHCIKSIKTSDDNTSFIKEDFTIQFPDSYAFDKTHMPSLELIKSNKDTRDNNIPIYLEFKNIFNKPEYDSLLKNIHINEDSFIIQKIYGDGNCLFRCISYFLTGTESYHLFMRNLLFNYIENNLAEILAEFPYIYYEGGPINTEDYIPLIKESGNYGGELECNLFTKIFPINILVVTYNENKDKENTYEYYMYYGFNKSVNYLPLCIMEYKESNKHYQILYYNKNYNDNIFKENSVIKEEKKDTQSQNEYNNNIINEEKNQTNKNYQNKNTLKITKENFFEYNNKIEKIYSNKSKLSENNLIIKHENYLNFEANKIINKKENFLSEKQIKDNKIINTNNKILGKDENLNTTIEKLKEGLKPDKLIIENYKIKNSSRKEKHKPNDYPIYPYNSDDPEGFYANMYNYIYQRKQTLNEANYPKYIYEFTDEITIETKKRAFRKAAENYEIDNLGYLCYKIPDKEEDESTESENDSQDENNKIKETKVKLQSKKKSKKELIKCGQFSLYRILYQVNEYELIKNIHEQNNHRNWEDTRKEFKKLKYYYRGYINDIKYIISKCSACYQKNSKFFKREKCKTIIFDNPKDRYVLDITELPVNIDINDEYKYLLNIIDHFSKLCKSYLLKNKEAFGILQCIKDYINIYGKPHSIGTDNGREFKNKLINDYMNEKKIKFIHGLPYKPHSQGVCEIVHKTIKVGLILRKLENKNKFIIKDALESTVSAYNNTIHNVTRATPLEIFYSTNNKFLKKIKKNILNYYNKKNNNLLDYELDDKVLISSNIIVKRNKKDNFLLIEKNKVKKEKALYNICGVIVNILSAGIYDVLISDNYENYNLKKNDKCRLSSDLFKVVPVNVWNIIIGN